MVGRWDPPGRKDEAGKGRGRREPEARPCAGCRWKHCFPRCGPSGVQVCWSHRAAEKEEGRLHRLTEGVSGVALAQGWHI